ncbi:MAG: hypothetical protein KKA19_00235 [Candidatus Margulisbacteria bacterium]|nr:hypothetical protein [Candidatus Margulisiibacteriota bacterium]
MTNIIPSIFENGYLKIYAESIQNLSEANSEKEIENAVRQGFNALEKVTNTQVRENAKQRLRVMEEMARQRIAKNKS